MRMPNLEGTPRFLVCCDWGLAPGGRAIYVGDAQARTLGPGGPTPFCNANGDPWTLSAVLELGRRLRDQGPVLLAFDMPLGIPASYLDAARAVPRWSAATSFVEWLPLACAEGTFHTNVDQPEAWAVEQPFARVPSGSGSLKRIHARAAREGVVLRREVDALTNATPVFIAAGIPGAMGTAARQLWRELSEALTLPSRDFGVWPFEGTLQEVLETHGLAVGELLPHAALAIALLDEPPAERPRLYLAKAYAEDRARALTQLQAARWTQPLRIDDEGLAHAGSSPEAFAALMSAAALLRCTLEGTALSALEHEDSVAEGGLLGSGSVNLSLHLRPFRARAPRLPALSRLPRAALQARPLPPRPNPKRIPKGQTCPIPGCDHRFMIGRGGWDAHVSTLRRHHDWAPELQDAQARMRRFREEFPDFFA